MNCTLTWYICLTDDGSKTDTIREIKEMTNQDNRLYVSVLAEDISSLENYFHNATVIVMVLTVLVSLFSFINLLNTSITNVISRKHDYALLEATGMTKSRLEKRSVPKPYLSCRQFCWKLHFRDSNGIYPLQPCITDSRTFIF